MEKIKQIVNGEGAECVVTTPMDKLEAFFIRTVAAAQAKDVPTSGAVSTTQIGGFLAEQAPVETILDKLVAAPVSERDVAVEPAKPDAVTAAEGAKDNTPDKQLLSELAEPVVAAEQIKTEPVAPDGESSAQQPTREGILDQLTGRSAPDDEEQTDKPSGDADDA